MVLQEVKFFPKTSGIYKITNPTGKVYIGQTRNIQRRIRYYLYSVPKTTKIGRSILKYGIENHIVQVLELTENLEERELYYIHKYNSVEEGLNCIYRNYKIEKKFSGGSKWSKERKQLHSRRIKELYEQGVYQDRPYLGKNLKGTMSVLDTRDGKIKRVTKEEYDSCTYLVGTTKGKKVPKRCKKILDTETQKIYNSVVECIKELNVTNTKFYKMINSRILMYLDK
jgi:group I intron endonuclease